MLNDRESRLFERVGEYPVTQVTVDEINPTQAAHS